MLALAARSRRHHDRAVCWRRRSRREFDIERVVVLRFLREERNQVKVQGPEGFQNSFYATGGDSTSQNRG
jgi:hypothetical protein